MSVYRSQVVAFARYAGAQVAQAAYMLKLHRPDGTGCCRSCGRSFPCDDAAQWSRRFAHYRQWAVDEHIERPSLVRPYVVLDPDEPMPTTVSLRAAGSGRW